MKKVIICIILMLMFVSTNFSNAQTFKTSNFKKSNKEIYTDTTTIFKYELNDKVYNVFRAKSGALYIYVISSNGKHKGRPVKHFLPKNVQEAMDRKYGKYN